MKQIFKVGDQVFDIRYGWGLVKAIGNGALPVIVEFAENESCSYTLYGKGHSTEKIPILSFSEYELKGFSQERPFDYNDYIGKWGFVWNGDTKSSIIVIGKLLKYKKTYDFPFIIDYTSNSHYEHFEPITEEQIKILNL